MITPSPDEPPKLLRMLVLSRDLALVGGVVSYVRNQKHAMSASVEFHHMTIGRRDRESLPGKCLRSISDPMRLNGKVKKNSIDVVQVNTSLKTKPLLRDSVFCWLAARIRRTALAVIFHGWDSRVAAAIGRNVLLRTLFRQSFGRARLTIVLSERFVSEAISLGLPAASVHVLPSMFDDREFRPFRIRPVDKDSLILFLSRLDRKKGAMELIEAFVRGVHGLWPTWRLVIAGEGPERRNAEALVRATGMSDKVSIVGQVTGQAKLSLYKKASIFALPTSEDEGLPISILEGMSAGCALLTTSVGGLAEVLEDEKHGKILSSVSVDAIHSGLKTLICQERQRIRSQQNCHHMAWEQFSSSKVVGELEQLLCDMQR